MLNDFKIANPDWSDIEIKELRQLYATNKSIYEISQKLRRPQREIISKVSQLDLYRVDVDRPLINIHDPPKETIIVKIPEDFKKQPSDNIPDIGVVLINIKNNLALLHQDAIAIEQKINNKFDELQAAIKENTELKKRELIIIEEQYAQWKQKHNPPL